MQKANVVIMLQHVPLADEHHGLIMQKRTLSTNANIKGPDQTGMRSLIWTFEFVYIKHVYIRN